VFSWSASIGLSIAGIRNGRSTFCGSAFSNQGSIKAVHSTVAFTALPRRCGNFAGSCVTLATIPNLMGKDEVDEKALVGLQGIVRISRTTLNGRCFLNLGGFAPASEWDELSGSLASSQEVSHDV
jgi:hypothetical protein